METHEKETRPAVVTARPQHTPEPWQASASASRNTVFIEDAGIQCHTITKGVNAYANAARIVACVNALAGLDPAAIPALIEAADDLLGMFAEAHREEVETDHHGDGPECSYCTSMEAVRAALAKVKGVAS